MLRPYRSVGYFIPGFGDLFEHLVRVLPAVTAVASERTRNDGILPGPPRCSRSSGLWASVVKDTGISRAAPGSSKRRQSRGSEPATSSAGEQNVRYAPGAGWGEFKVRLSMGVR